MSVRRAVIIAVAGVAAGLAAAPAPAANASAGGREACAALAGRSTSVLKVTEASWQPGPVAAGPGGPAIAAPEHCLVRLMIGARPSTLPDMGYGTGIEIRLPANWNGRMLFQGGGGMNGVLLPAVGRVAGHPSALERGFAVVSTDSGHQGRSPIDSRFGADQQAKLDFAYQAVERATRESKSLLAAYYGRPADRTYYMGCSTGGREALLAAQRLPLEYDGVISGNAARDFTRLVANQVWSLQQVMRIAPRGADGKPDPSRAFSDEQLGAVSDAVLARCDALDGLRDGMINDHAACDFTPRSLVCGTAGAPAAPRCLSAPQAEVLVDIFGGARNSRGEPVYGSFPFDTGIASPAWRGMHLGTNGNPPANATLGVDSLRNYVVTPPDPDLDPLAFDFDRDLERTAETAAINDAIGTQHETFAGRGGKLIVYHGLSDQAMSTGSLVRWYERLTPRDAQGPQSWARLFLVPGMTHCGGGQSTDQFDLLAAIQAWVEEGKAPDRVIARGDAFPGKTRPLCPHPRVARYDGGDENDAASFSCR